MGAEISAEEFDAAYDGAARSLHAASSAAFLTPFDQDQELDGGDDEGSATPHPPTISPALPAPLYGVLTPRNEPIDHETRERERRRRRRDNYRHERDEEKAKFKARLKASKRGFCCKKASDSEPETPTDPGSDFSDQNFYRTRTGTVRRRHRRAASDPYGFGEEPPSPVYGYLSVPYNAVSRIILMIELRERLVIAACEDTARAGLRAAFDIFVAAGRAANGGDEAAHLLSPRGDGGQPMHLHDTEDYARARVLVEESPELAEAFNLLFHNPSLPAKSRLALVRNVSALLEPTKDGRPKRFDMGGIQLGDDGALLATRVMRTQPQLCSIVLASTGLTDFGLDVITVTLDMVDPQSLSELDLSGNRITFKGAFRLVTKLCEIYTAARPAKQCLTVNLDGNERLWMTGRSDAKAFVERVGRLAEAKVAVTLPEPPTDD